MTLINGTANVDGKRSLDWIKVKSVCLVPLQLLSVPGVHWVVWSLGARRLFGSVLRMNGQVRAAMFVESSVVHLWNCSSVLSDLTDPE